MTHPLGKEGTQVGCTSPYLDGEVEHLGMKIWGNEAREKRLTQDYPGDDTEILAS